MDGGGRCDGLGRYEGARLSVAIKVRRRVFDPINVLKQLHSSQWNGCDVVDGGGFGDEL